MKSPRLHDILPKIRYFAYLAMSQIEIDQAVALLRAGKLVALPTETVYGLGADAQNADALAKIFLIKERPFTHPLIVHLASVKQLPEWARDIPTEASLLAKIFWPGPLTLILKKQAKVLDLLTGGQDTIGLRIPSHPVAQALLQAFGGGVAAPSANRFSHLSPTTADAVRDELGNKVDYILDGGPCEVGIESTILDLSRSHPVILRPGMITGSQIEAVLKQPVQFSRQDAPRVSGMDHVHYSPDTKMILISSADTSTFLNNLTTADLPLAFLTRQKPSFQRDGIHWIVMADNPQQYAHDLYFTLRGLDKQRLKSIVVESVPNTLGWEAIQDRLQKAAMK